LTENEIYKVDFTEDSELRINDSDFEDLIVWSKARELRIEFEKIAKTLPSDEKYALVSQVLRASRSVTNNIAEGYGRYHYQENVQFCRHSRGSLYELTDHLIIMRDNNYITQEKYLELKKKIKEVLKILNGYINFLIKQKTETNKQ
jgi:four helix bundle protein